MKHQITRDEKVITWMGQIREANTKSFDLFVESLRNINPLNGHLVIRRHPKDTVSKEEYAKKARGFSLIETDNEDTVSVRRGSDVVVTMFSTQGLLHSLEGGHGTIFIKIPKRRNG